jgi:MFS superfamily sulfate permease-like transporter
MRDLTKHFPHYFSLIGIFVASFIGFIVFSYDKEFQMAIIASLSLSYFSWGVVHHFIHKDLTLQVLIEYAVFSFLGFVIGVSLVYRS